MRIYISPIPQAEVTVNIMSPLSVYIKAYHKNKDETGGVLPIKTSLICTAEPLELQSAGYIIRSKEWTIQNVFKLCLEQTLGHACTVQDQLGFPKPNIW